MSDFMTSSGDDRGNYNSLALNFKKLRNQFPAINLMIKIEIRVSLRNYMGICRAVF